jgi:Domain of unknown function (DUF4110)/Kelch motif/Galactose oxidase, central domain
LANVASDQLFKFELATQKWKQIVGAPRPPPRCAHSTVYFNRCLYVFGGEVADEVSGGYNHFRDLWKFDAGTLLWIELKSQGAPFPRSGHSAVAWKHYMIIFGGFHEAASKDTPRWFDDVCVFNMQTEQWLTIPYSKLTQRPAPRSGCNTALIDDTWIVHGGFAKRPRRADSATTAPGPEGMVYTDAWSLQLEPVLSGNPPTWERLLSSLTTSQRQTDAANLTANGRSGCGSVMYSKNMLLFGGVVDQEMHHHVVDSIFYNDLSLLHVEKRKFLPLFTRTEEDLSNGDVEGLSRGWNIEKMRSHLFGFLDAHGNLVYEKSVKVNTEDSTDGEEALSKIVEREEPLPRIKPALVVDGTTLYVFGGLLEVGDREVTLDDMWSIDLRKNRKWECVFAGTMHKQVWLGGVHDDNDSYSSTADSTGRNNSDDEEDASESDEEDSKMKAKSHREQINELVEKYRLDDADETPEPEESLDGFTARTLPHWTTKVKSLNTTDCAAEERARGIAIDRFYEVEPVIEMIKGLVLARQRKKKEEKKKKPGR